MYRNVVLRNYIFSLIFLRTCEFKQIWYAMNQADYCLKHFKVGNVPFLYKLEKKILYLFLVPVTASEFGFKKKNGKLSPFCG